MIAGCIVLVAILFSIFVSAARSFPDFVRRMRIGSHFAERFRSQAPDRDNATLGG